MFEDTKEAVNRWKTDNDKKNKDKGILNNLEKTTTKTKDWATWTQ
jgi:hypothetical protein